MLIKAQQNKRYVIAGAGYAGRMAAMRLRIRFPQAQIIVVDPSEKVHERARYHEFMGGWRTQEKPMRKALPRGAEHLRGWVESIDEKERLLSVRVGDAQQEIAADGIIVAFGSRTKALAFEGATIPVMGAEDKEVSALLRRSFSREAPLVVVGTGLTGTEIASALVERWGAGSVILLGKDRPGHLFPQASQAYIDRYCERVGLRVVVDLLDDMEGDVLKLRSGGSLRAGAVLSCVGFSYPTFARDMGWSVNAQGQALVLPSLALPQSEGVFVAGDMASCFQGGPNHPTYRSSCATAMPMGAHAAEQMALLERNDTLQPFSMGYAVQCLALGRRDGVLQFVDKEDRAVERFWTGRYAAWVKEIILKMTWYAPALEGSLRFPVYRWPLAPVVSGETDGHTKPAL
ncbi:MAG: FAD-dependent oxidoreductase [Myxococcales bacterium]|nr:FAD-dependent oxidoreductase [Myxococcales bacterium]